MIFGTAIGGPIFVSNLDAQGFLALLPIAGALLVGLQRIEYPQNFRRATADRKIGHIHKVDDVLGVDMNIVR